MSFLLNNLCKLPSLPNPFGDQLAHAYSHGFEQGAAAQARVDRYRGGSWDDQRCGRGSSHDRDCGDDSGGWTGGYRDFGNYGGYGQYGYGGHRGGDHNHSHRGGHGDGGHGDGNWGSWGRPGQGQHGFGYGNCDYGDFAPHGYGHHGHGSHGVGGNGGGSATQPRGDLAISRVGSDVQIKTPGKYIVTFTSGDPSKGGQMKIVSPNGAETLMEGDPHTWVDKDGKGPLGSKLAFDYKGKLTLHLNDGTILDFDTKLLPNGTAVLDRATGVPKYGNNGVVISGLSSGENALVMETGTKRLIDPLISGTPINWDIGGSGDYTYNNDYGGLSNLTQDWINSHETV